MDEKAIVRQRSTTMEILVKEIFLKDFTWDDHAEFFVWDKGELQEEFRQYMLDRFEGGEVRLKKVEDRITENEKTRLGMLEIDLGLAN
ncbi:hypothetical protein [Bariatricus sp. HCP28S3_D3]|uniref:hypothetical protein n=1 Tax=Bariatricus sp. HCP28S3_D3 TaxID=3438901 RepID=UPI003F8A08CA